LEKFKTEALGFPDRAKRIIVHDNLTLTVANDFVHAVKEMRKEVANSYDPIIEKARKTRDEALAQKRKYDDPLKEAEKIIKLHIASYLEEQVESEEKRRKRLEEKRRRGRRKRKKCWRGPKSTMTQE